MWPREFTFTKINKLGYCPGTVIVDGDKIKVLARRTTTYDIEKMLNYKIAMEKDLRSIIVQPCVYESLLEYACSSNNVFLMKKIISRCFIPNTCLSILNRIIILTCDISIQTGLLFQVRSLIKESKLLQACLVVTETRKTLDGVIACVLLTTQQNIPHLSDVPLPKFLSYVHGIEVRLDALRVKESAINGRDKDEKLANIYEKIAQERENMGRGYSYVPIKYQTQPLTLLGTSTAFNPTIIVTPKPKIQWAAAFEEFLKEVRNAIFNNCETPDAAHVLIAILCDPVACSTISVDCGITAELSKLFDSFLLRTLQLTDNEFIKECQRRLDEFRSILLLPGKLPWHPCVVVLYHMLFELDKTDRRSNENIIMCMLHIFLILKAVEDTTNPKDIGLLLYSAYTKIQLDWSDFSTYETEFSTESLNLVGEDTDLLTIDTSMFDSTSPILAACCKRWDEICDNSPPTMLKIQSGHIDMHRSNEMLKMITSITTEIFSCQLNVPNKNMSGVTDLDILTCVTWDPCAIFATYGLSTYDTGDVSLRWTQPTQDIFGEIFKPETAPIIIPGGFEKKELFIPQLTIDKKTVEEYDKHLEDELKRLCIYTVVERQKEKKQLKALEKKHMVDGKLWITDIENVGDDKLIDMREYNILTDPKNDKLTDEQVIEKMLITEEELSYKCLKDEDSIEKPIKRKRKLEKNDNPIFVTTAPVLASLGKRVRNKTLATYSIEDMRKHLISSHSVLNRTDDEIKELPDSEIRACFLHAVGESIDKKYMRERE
jgi:hypothetical protein